MESTEPGAAGNDPSYFDDVIAQLRTADGYDVTSSSDGVQVRLCSIVCTDNEVSAKQTLMSSNVGNAFANAGFEDGVHVRAESVRLNGNNTLEVQFACPFCTWRDQPSREKVKLYAHVHTTTTTETQVLHRRPHCKSGGNTKSFWIHITDKTARLPPTEEVHAVAGVFLGQDGWIGWAK